MDEQFGDSETQSCGDGGSSSTDGSSADTSADNDDGDVVIQVGPVHPLQPAPYDDVQLLNQIEREDSSSE